MTVNRSPVAVAGWRAIKKRPKYGNRKTILDGVEHASRKQGLRWVLLRQRERDGDVRGLRREVKYRLEINGKLICSYIADHVYEELTGNKWVARVEDVKSEPTRKNRVYRIKKKLMRALHNIEIWEV